jgi:hypothetical protein
MPRTFEENFDDLITSYYFMDGGGSLKKVKESDKVDLFYLYAKHNMVSLAYKTVTVTIQK